jgi:type VI secretion system protein ImpH
MATSGRRPDAPLDSSVPGHAGPRRSSALTAAKEPAVPKRPVRRADQSGLDELLMSQPYRFDYFQAVRILTHLYPQREPVGRDAVPDQEIARFRSHVSFVFPPSDLYAGRPAEEERPAELIVTFMGLAGSLGALPQYYTELIMDRARQKDTTLRDFLDLFNHRLISLFYRAWEKYRFYIAYEQAELEGRSKLAAGSKQYAWFVQHERPQLDRFSQCLLDLAGLGTPALRYRAQVTDRLESRTRISDETWRYYCGLLAQRHRCAVGLGGILEGYWGYHFAIEQFRGQWLNIAPEFQTSLIPLGGNTDLGVNVVVGERVWDVQSKFRVSIGPLTYDQFCSLLPNTLAFSKLANLTRVYAGRQFDFDVQLVLRKEEVPASRLGGSDEDGARLGWNSWIWNEPFQQDVDDAVFLVDD